MQSKQDKVIMQNHLTEVYDQLVKEKQSALNKNVLYFLFIINLKNKRKWKIVLLKMLF